ncbi:MAG: pilus assembly protein [Bryobacterales bacterium]|nr:pilus assembly protein [Bryobacterales bacterium]
MKRERGSILLETAMYLPVLLLLLLGMISLAKLTYTYYALEKTLYTVARYVGTQQGVNFCDDTDTIVQAAKTLALTGSTDGDSPVLIQGLSAGQIQVRIERLEVSTGEIAQCDCSAQGCDTSAGGQGPDYIVVSIPEGYPFTPVIPQLPIDPILLKPRVRVPFQGT